MARTGGDEFVLLLPETNKDQASVIAERLRSAVKNFSFDFKANRISSTVSIGITAYPFDSDSIDTLLNVADKAMYASKQAGKNLLSGHNQNR